MPEEIIELKQDHSSSALYSPDLAPVPKAERSWSMWNLAAIWVGMAVCIPTYLLASYMIKSGLSWVEALLIIGLANLIITVPMVLNGHAGVKYGIPFPVLGRASFGNKGIHIASILRAIVACGWFGIQTWIGGLAIYAIWNAATGMEGAAGLSIGKFVGFAVFWFINIYFVWKGTESIKWLEIFSAPILILIGVLLIAWGANKAGGFAIVLEQSEQLVKPVAVLTVDDDRLATLHLNPLRDIEGKVKAREFQLTINDRNQGWARLPSEELTIGNFSEEDHYQIQFRKREGQHEIVSSVDEVIVQKENEEVAGVGIWGYTLWLTAMLGFWATMSLSIADITRYASTQKAQITGQFIGLPGTMILYSFVGIFVTCAAIINFDDLLIANDAPWDPVSLLSKFENPIVVIIAQIFMIIATLSTNIAANVIAPANAFSNLMPHKIDFKTGGLITGIIGILICPWWLMDEISGILIFISGLLGPVLGILLADYFVIRKTELDLDELYVEGGVFSYNKTGFNRAAVIAFVAGVSLALIGYWIPALEFLYSLSWFTGFAVGFGLYWYLMKKSTHVYSH